MYRSFYVLIFILAICHGVTGQTGFDKLIVGKKLVVRVDRDPKVGNLQLDGQADYWDLSKLRFDDTKFFQIKNANSGSAIPIVGQADVLLEAGGLEYYYTYDGTRLLFNGSTDVRLLYNRDMHDHVIKFDGNVDYDTKFSNKGVVISKAKGTVELYSDDLPREITKSWDELNYRYILERNINQKIFKGKRTKLDLPSGSISGTQVIVERKIEQQVWAKDVEYIDSNIKIESDLTKVIFEKEIRFYKKGFALPLLKVILNQDTNEILEIVYTDYYESNDRAGLGQEGMSIHPNPTFGKSDIYLKIKNPGNYKVLVKNILGRVIHQEDIYIDDELNVPVDLIFLRKGSYLCSLEDENGRTIVTKRLIILKP